MGVTVSHGLRGTRNAMELISSCGGVRHESSTWGREHQEVAGLGSGPASPWFPSTAPWALNPRSSP